jgi:predicted HicB family RNase H-like nuclease
LADERALLQAGMSVLSMREQRILQMRYYEDRSQVDIAREIGLSQAQVSRLLRRAVDRMRAAVVEESDVAYPREEMATREIEEPQPQQQSTHSGRLLVRMPQSLHAELARVAEHEGVSLNTLITGALASSVGWRDGSVDGLAVVDAEDDRPASQRPRWTSIALAANLVVVVLAAAVAIVLLVVALGHGW